MRSLLNVVGVGLLVAGCGTKVPATSTQQGAAVIGAAGGTVASFDGTVILTVPPGALASDVTVTIAPAASPGAATISQVYEIGPTGTAFAMPASVVFKYGSINLGTTPASALRVATFEAGAWQILSGTVVDTKAKTAAATTMHLSPYAMVAAGTPAACATVYGGLVCGGSSGGSTSGGLGNVTAVGPGTPDCVPATCAASSDACAPYPGATRTACTDGPSGYTATCCFPAGAQACLATMAFEGCSLPGLDAGATCPGTPTCATDTFACSQYSGATLRDCTDNPNGYTGACCFSASQPVCYVVSSGGSCWGADGSTACPTTITCENSQPAALCANGTTVSSCTNTPSGFAVTCCYPVGTLPSSGTMPADGGAGTGGVSGSGGGGGASGQGGGGASGGQPDAGGRGCFDSGHECSRDLPCCSGVCCYPMFTPATGGGGAGGQYAIGICDSLC